MTRGRDSIPPPEEPRVSMFDAVLIIVVLFAVIVLLMSYQPDRGIYP